MRSPLHPQQGFAALGRRGGVLEFWECFRKGGRTWGKAVVVIGAWLALAGVLGAAESPLPKGWEPDLEEAFELLKTEAEDAPQQMINRITARQLEIRDAELALAYLRLWTQLSPEEQAKLKVEQAAWLSRREKLAAAIAKDEGEGTVAPMAGNLAGIKFTEQRLAELRKRIASLAKASAPKPPKAKR